MPCGCGCEVFEKAFATMIFRCEASHFPKPRSGPGRDAADRPLVKSRESVHLCEVAAESGGLLRRFLLPSHPRSIVVCKSLLQLDLV